MMKKLFFIAVIILVAASSNSLKAQFSAGAGVGYGFEVEAVAIQLRGMYDIADQWRAGADFDYYLDGNEGISYWEFNANGHFKFANMEKFDAYALAGLNFFHVKADELVFGFGDVSSTDTNLNIGAGLTTSFTEKVGGFAELKYTIGDADQLFLSAGVLFKF